MSRAETLITEHIATWTGAIQTKSTAGRGSSNKYELYGIKKLRELILELAVRGKLVPQDSSDEPASVLLERIAAEKAELIKAKKIKKPKALPPINDEEKPFELPEGWEWVRFGNIYQLEYGNNLPQNKRSNSGEFPVYGSNGIVGSHNEYSVDSACIVVGRKGSAGALNLSMSNGCWVTDVAYSCTPPSEIDLNFSFKLFHTLNLNNLGKGIKPGLNRNEAHILVLAIPPLAEQQRIVQKVDELMALCDQLEQQTESSIEAHATLVDTLLSTLTNSADADELQQNWARLAGHFDTLFTTEKSIDSLKQTILQLAVTGRLTEIKQKFKESPFSKDFFPAQWEIKKLSDIAEAIVDCPHSTPKWTESGIICIRTSQIFPRKLDLSNIKYVSEDTYHERTKRIIPEEGDILYSREGGILGIAAMIPPQIRLCMGQRMMLIRCSSDAISPEYLEIVLNSPLITKIARENTTGGAAPRVNVTTVKSYPIPVPSLATQSKVVSKADELMALCEQLKDKLRQSQQTQVHLTDAIVDQALA